MERLYKSKLKYPHGHLTSLAARVGRNLLKLFFPGAGHLITTYRGGEFDL